MRLLLRLSCDVIRCLSTQERIPSGSIDVTLAHTLKPCNKNVDTDVFGTTDIDKIDRPITTDITTRSQPANAWGGNAARRK